MLKVIGEQRLANCSDTVGHTILASWTRSSEVSNRPSNTLLRHHECLFSPQAFQHGAATVGNAALKESCTESFTTHSLSNFFTCCSSKSSAWLSPFRRSAGSASGADNGRLQRSHSHSFPQYGRSLYR